jgi:ABC-type transport system involved in multi-copper enzyme maturation permease subunit
MKALVLAEVLKIRSTRTTLGLVVAALALVPLTVTVSVPAAGTDNPPVALDDPSLLAVAVGNSFGVPLVLALLLGGLAFTQEFRYGTITSTYLVEPERNRVLVAKWVASALASAAVTTATLAVSVPYAIALINYRDGAVNLGAHFWQMAAAGYVVMAVFAVIGVAIGALLRNQITAVVVVLVWTLAVEQIVITSYPSVGRWLPGATTWVLLQLGASVDPNGELLSAPASALLLTAYVVTAVALALRLTPKRDVL